MSAAAKLQLCKELVTSISEAIQSGQPHDEVLDMFVSSSTFKQVVCQWRHPKRNLDLLQLAVLHNQLPLVKYLCKEENTFVPWKPQHDDDGIIINSPFLLACNAGALVILQYLLSLEEEFADLMLLRTAGFLSNDGHAKDSKYPKLPFEVCLEGGHLDCCMFLCNFILSGSLYKETAEKVAMLNSSPLHQACHLGSADLVRLILKESTWGRYINAYDSSGLTPLHVAAMNGESECLQALLEHGAYVNVYAECRSVLHILYSYKRQPEKFPECTEILIKHAVDVNASDHNENTPLDYIAYEFGQKLVRDVTQCSRIVYVRYDPRQTMDKSPTIKLGKYRHILMGTMELLLEAKAHTHTIISRTPDGILVDHTIIHTLLQNTGWPLSSCMLNNPEDVYKALQLLFLYGCDPNVLAKHNLTSAFSTLLLQTLHEVRDLQMKSQFIHLFIAHGADLECIIPPPRHFRKHPTERMWSVRPMMLALQEKHPMEIINLLLNYMSLLTINKVLKNPKMRDWQMYILQLESNKSYRKDWLIVKQQLRNNVRSLKHMCKLNILHSVGRLSANVEPLPLPKSLILYLTDLEC